MKRATVKETTAMNNLPKVAPEESVNSRPTNMPHAPAATGRLSDLIEEDDDMRESTPDMTELQQLVSATAASVATEMRGFREELTGFRSELERLRTDDKVLNDMQERYRALSEEFHERNVLCPVFLMLIGIADRSRQRMAEAVETQKKCEKSGDRTVKRALDYIRQDRYVDLIEVENLLAIHGVERFETPGDRFDPSTQRCVERITVGDASGQGRIACRLLPGYRRDGRVVRQEFVSVCVTGDLNESKNDGGPEQC